MAEQTRGILEQRPATVAGRPEIPDLMAGETRAHARHRVCPRDGIGPNRADQMASEQRQARAARLACEKACAASRNGIEQPAQLRRVEVMQEQICDDQIEPLGSVLGPFEHVEHCRAGLPADLSIACLSFGRDEIEPIEQRQFHGRPNRVHEAGESEHQRTVAGSQLEHAQGRTIACFGAIGQQRSTQDAARAHETMNALQVSPRAARLRVIFVQSVEYFRAYQA